MIFIINSFSEKNNENGPSFLSIKTIPPYFYFFNKISIYKTLFIFLLKISIKFYFFPKKCAKYFFFRKNAAKYFFFRKSAPNRNHY